jgi:hypothetical protein
MISVTETTLWIAVVIYATLFYIIDTQRCKKMDLLLYLHNLISAFGNLGWLSGNSITLVLYVITLSVMVVLWAINKHLCFLTEWHNLQCGRPSSAPYFDIFYILGFKKVPFWNNYGHYIFASVTYTYAVYKLYQLKWLQWPKAMKW